MDRNVLWPNKVCLKLINLVFHYTSHSNEPLPYNPDNIIYLTEDSPIHSLNAPQLVYVVRWFVVIKKESTLHTMQTLLYVHMFIQTECIVCNNLWQGISMLPWQCNVTCRDNHFSSENWAMESIFDRKVFCQLYAETEVCVESFIALNTTSWDIKAGMRVTCKREMLMMI